MGGMPVRILGCVDAGLVGATDWWRHLGYYWRGAELPCHGRASCLVGGLVILVGGRHTARPAEFHMLRHLASIPRNGSSLSSLFECSGRNCRCFHSRLIAGRSYIHSAVEGYSRRDGSIKVLWYSPTSHHSLEASQSLPAFQLVCLLRSAATEKF